MEASGFEPGSSLSAGDVGFRLAPRINAAGRMDHAGEVVEMLLTPDESRARSIAQHLDLLNQDRQRACEVIVRQVQEQLGELGRPDPSLAGLVFYSPDWHRGVVGIVANRIVELYNRPAIVLGRDDRTGLVQGSGRSIAGFHLLETLESMPDLFIRFGGHKQAVGVTLEEERVAELNDNAAAEILHLAPFGLANRAPVLLMEGVEVRSAPETFGKDSDHLRLRLGNSSRLFAAKAWKFAGRASELAPGTRIDAAVSIDEDPYAARRGFSPWSLTLKDVRPA
jgi:single-stranded-DNA-specific exonuclease